MMKKKGVSDDQNIKSSDDNSTIQPNDSIKK